MSFSPCVLQTVLLDMVRRGVRQQLVQRDDVARDLGRERISVQSGFAIKNIYIIIIIIIIIIINNNNYLVHWVCEKYLKAPPLARWLLLKTGEQARKPFFSAS